MSSQSSRSRFFAERVDGFAVSRGGHPVLTGSSALRRGRQRWRSPRRGPASRGRSRRSADKRKARRPPPRPRPRVRGARCGSGRLGRRERPHPLNATSTSGDAARWAASYSRASALRRGQFAVQTYLGSLWKRAELAPASGRQPGPCAGIDSVMPPRSRDRTPEAPRRAGPPHARLRSPADPRL